MGYECSLMLLVGLVSLLQPAVHAQGADPPPNTRRVTIPPIIIKEPVYDIFFKEGESIEMPCVASGEPEPSYRWEYNRETFEPSGNDGRIAIQPGVGTLIFARPIEKDEGIYQCIAENTVGKAISIIINLKIAILKPFNAQSVRTHSPSLGNALSLTCIPPQSLPQAEVYWATIRSGEGLTPIYLTDRVSIDPQGNLHFANVIESDYQEGRTYVCIAHNQVMRETRHGADQKIIPQGDIYNRHEPQIMWTDPNNQVALLGGQARIKCIFSGSPTPRVTWERAFFPMPNRKHEESFGQELVIDDVRYEDNGKYECVGINDDVNVQIRRSFALTVEAAPYFLEGGTPESQDATEGETKTIRCNGTGLPEPDYVWQINHIPLSKIPANPRYIFERNSITIMNLTKDDAMVVQCNVTNKHGYAFANAYFNILTEPPIIIKAPLEEQKVAELQTIELTCHVFGSPKPLVVWKKGNEQLTGGRFSVRPNGNLQIMEVSLVDAGSYTCTATNRLDSTSATGSLIVRRRTHIQSAPLDVSIVEETEAKFTCTATTDPEEIKNLEIYWKKDGELINYRLAQRMFKNDMDNSLTISGTISLDTGKYTCMATNGLDSDEMSAQLTVQGKPDPPTNVKVECRDQEKKAELTWQPGRENYAPILNFIIQYNTSFSQDTWMDIETNVSQNVRRKDVDLSPYGNYTFRVIARNKIGMSPPSGHTLHTCKTDEDIPDKNPENVIGEGDEPGNLVIYWTPMPPTEHNGKSFKYIVGYRRADGGPEETRTIERPEVYHLVANQVNGEPYIAYDVYVKARNAMGDSREGIKWVRGYTGEDTPLTSVNDLQYEELEGDSIELLLFWTHVDTTPESIRGYFRGYRIQYWRNGEVEDTVREKDFILNATSQYPRPRMRRAAPEPVSLQYLLEDLPPFSDVTVQVRVLNKYYAGPPSNRIELRTNEGMPGPCSMFDVVGQGPTHFELVWEEPAEPNGVILSYLMSYQSITGLNLGRLKYRELITDTEKKRARLTGLEPDTDYRIYLTASTAVGKGEAIFLDSQTTTPGMPDPPTFDILALGESHVEIHWEPSRSGNPGSVFYVQHRPRGAYSWLDSPDQVLHYKTNVTYLLTGTTYQIRVVAKNGGQFQAPAEWQEFTTGGIAPGRIELATAGWFYGIFVALLLVVIIMAGFIALKRWRDGWWVRKEAEIDEQVRQLQAEEAAMAMGVTNQYAVTGSREMVGQPDMSHVSLHSQGSVYKDEPDDESEEESEDDDNPPTYNNVLAQPWTPSQPQYQNTQPYPASPAPAPAQQQYGYHPAQAQQSSVGYHPGHQVQYHPDQYQIQDPPAQGASFI